MYSEGEKTLKIVELGGNGLDFDLDIEDGLVDPYLEL